MSKTIYRGELAGYGYVPPGGSAGQVLVKVTSADGDTAWADVVATSGGGGTASAIEQSVIDDIVASAIAGAQSAIFNSESYANILASVSTLDQNIVEINSRVNSVNVAVGDVSVLVGITSAALQSAISYEATRIDTLVAVSNEIYVTVSAPSVSGTSATGAIWYDSDDGNHPYRWDGTTWEDIQDAEISVNRALILAEQSVRAETSAALASDIQAIFVNVGSLSASIINEQQVRASVDGVQAAQITALQASVSSNYGLILTESSVRAETSAALASQYTAVLAVANAKNRTFFQATAPTSATTGDIWYRTTENNQPYRWDGATWVSAVDPRIAANAAAIITETSARADTSSALASQITTLQSQVSGHSATLTIHADAIDGMSTNYFVKSDVNGHVAGFGLYNDSSTSDFIIVADKFGIVTSAGGGISPFQVINSTVYMTDVIISSALIQNLTVARLTSGTCSANFTQDGNISLRNGLFISSSSPNMRVMGAGFGNGNVFTDWFGPAGNPTTVTSTSAIWFINTSGEAYFGGQLKPEYRPVAWGRYNQTSDTTWSTTWAYNCSVGAPASTGTGRTRITFDTNRPSSNYVVVANGQENGGGEGSPPNAIICMPWNHNIFYFNIMTRNASGDAKNADQVSFIVFAPD